jgi:transposase
VLFRPCGVGYLVESLMLRPVDPGEVPEATAALAWRVHPKGTDEMRVRDALGPLFRDEDFLDERFAGMFPPLGQPGCSPALLAMVTVLQFLHNLSDREAVAAMADRISWKYALGLELADTGFDASVLSEFRARLAEPGRADGLLDTVLDKLKAAGLIGAGGRARTDSTHVIAAVRTLHRIELVGETLRAALEEIASVSENWIVPLLDAGWHERYGRKVELARLLGRGSRKTTAAKLCAQIGADGQSLLEAIAADRGAGWINLLPRVQLLRTVWDQQFHPDAKGRLVLKDVPDLPPAAGRIRSPYDTDARYSTKGTGAEQDLEWIGTKAHLTESCDQDLPRLITDVHTTAATDPDLTATTAIQNKLIARALAPAIHLMDAGYPSAANIAASAEAGITQLAPLTASPGRNPHAATFTPYDFPIDWQTGTATCPHGATSQPMRPEARGLVNFGFSRADCTPCPIRARCTPAALPIARRITVHPEPLHQARLAAHRAQNTPGWHTTYHLRAGIEATISQAVRGPDLRHSRYRGLAKAHVQNIAIGIALNITRLGTHYNTTPTTPRPPTRIHHLCTTHGIIKAT